VSKHTRYVRRPLTLATRRILQVYRLVLPNQMNSRSADSDEVKSRSLLVEVAGISEGSEEGNAESCQKWASVVAEQDRRGPHADLDIVFLVLTSVDGV
jgi:hypothetical protein